MASVDQIQFETPENIQVSYRAAGLGTRFLAWFLDTLLIALAIFLIFLVLLLTGIASDVVLRLAPGTGNPENPEHAERVLAYVAGIFLLINGLGGFVYYILWELLRRGQTWGKRQMGLRVVKVDGFSLDPTSIFVRNIFRVIDNLPILWIVPLVTERSQRLGDLVAGTIVVVDKIERMTSVREVLSARTPLESKFRFDTGALKLSRPEDVRAVENILERWSALSTVERELLLSRLVEPLAKRMKVEAPPEADRLRFLEDFLAATYRRQHLTLG
jgi:uncharacterized RDD family membrane protein YckC